MELNLASTSLQASWKGRLKRFRGAKFQNFSTMVTVFMTHSAYTIYEPPALSQTFFDTVLGANAELYSLISNRRRS